MYILKKNFFNSVDGSCDVQKIHVPARFKIQITLCCAWLRYSSAIPIDVPS